MTVFRPSVMLGHIQNIVDSPRPTVQNPRPHFFLFLFFLIIKNNLFSWYFFSKCTGLKRRFLFMLAKQEQFFRYLLGLHCAYLFEKVYIKCHLGVKFVWQNYWKHKNKKNSVLKWLWWFLYSWFYILACQQNLKKTTLFYFMWPYFLFILTHNISSTMNSAKQVCLSWNIP